MSNAFDNVVARLRECERWLDGVRQERRRERFEREWNTLQDEAAALAHFARKDLAALDALAAREETTS